MKAAIVLEAGQAPKYGDFAEPAPAPGEHRISVTAAALSQLARSRASGAHYSSSGRFPFVAGVDGVGRLEDGTRVYFVLPTAPHGAFAERSLATAAQCLPLPDEIDDVIAAAIANPGMSSWLAYEERAKLAPGETVLVNGATGASGRLAVRIAKHLGAKKIIATGRNRQALAALGADVTIPLAADDEILEAQFAEGVDVVVDYLWGKSAERLLVAAAKGAPGTKPIRFVQIGSASGVEIGLPSAVLRSSPIILMGSGLGSVPKARMLQGLAELFRAVAAGGFEIATQTIPLSRVEQAWGLDDVGRRIVFTV